jgi:hypothetical protein
MMLDNVASLLGRLEGLEVVSVSTDEPMLKLSFAFEFVRSCLEKSIRVHYLDLDLQFSSLIQNLPTDISRMMWGDERLVIEQPADAGIVEAIFRTQFDSNAQGGGLVVLDSINMMQNILSASGKSLDQLKANHECALLISLLQLLARKQSAKILILGLERSRPKTRLDHSVTWEKELVGGRMMRYKSDLSLLMRRTAQEASEGGLVVDVFTVQTGSIEQSDLRSSIWLPAL